MIHCRGREGTLSGLLFAGNKTGGLVLGEQRKRGRSAVSLLSSLATGVLRECLLKVGVGIKE